MQYHKLTPNYKISRIIKGNWQLSDSHSEFDTQNGANDMLEYAKAGITTFDMADIYTGAEEMAGRFLRQYPDAQIHTKYVPDKNLLSTITQQDTIETIERSLARLNLKSLDLVQFHWWDYAQPKYLETLKTLQELQTLGKIKHLGVTNFNVQKMQEFVDAGIKIETIQLQYSLLDSRPEKKMLEFCKTNNITVLCYGVLAGGFLSDFWLGKSEPKELENRSLVKYKLIIDDIGGWNKFQKLLQVLDKIAKKHQATISNIATKYILEKSNAVILGSRNTKHLKDTLQIFSIDLDFQDLRQIQDILEIFVQLDGDCYDLERNDPKHSGIMKYNLNKKT